MTIVETIQLYRGRTLDRSSIYQNNELKKLIICTARFQKINNDGHDKCMCMVRFLRGSSKADGFSGIYTNNIYQFAKPDRPAGNTT